MLKAWVFALPLLWMLFLTQNVPFSTLDDPTIHYLAKTTPASKIAARIVNPLTPAWTYQFQALGGEQNSLGLRPVELLIWKTTQSLFGTNAFAFHFLKALFVGLVAVFIFEFTRRLTRKKGVAVLAALFYATTLSVYNSATVITVFDLLAQFFQGLAIIFFLHLYRESDEAKVPAAKFAPQAACLFLLVWLAIKTYETVKILPLILLAFLGLAALSDLRARLKNKKFLLLAAVTLLMGFLVVPVAKSHKVYDTQGQEIKNPTSLEYHWDTLYRFTLQNTRNAWEPEKDIALFSLKSYLPFSIARTFGFFLCWAVLFSLALVLARNREIRSWDREKKSAVALLALWAAVDIAALGLPRESDGRHLMAPLIPLTILSAFLIVEAHSFLNKKMRKVFAGACLAAWAFAFFTNAGHILYFRKFIGGVQIAQDKYLSYIYNDFYGVKEHSYDDFIRFMRVPEALCVWHIPFIVDELYGDFDEKVRPKHLSDVYARYGKAYVVTTDPARIPADPRYREVAEFDQTNKSLYTDWVLRFKKKKSPVHRVFKFSPG